MVRKGSKAEREGNQQLSLKHQTGFYFLQKKAALSKSGISYFRLPTVTSIELTSIVTESVDGYGRFIRAMSVDHKTLICGSGFCLLLSSSMG